MGNALYDEIDRLKAELAACRSLLREAEVKLLAEAETRPNFCKNLLKRIDAARGKK